MLKPRLASLAVLLGASLISLLFYKFAMGEMALEPPVTTVLNTTMTLEFFASVIFAFIAYSGFIGILMSFASLQGASSGKFVWRDNFSGRVFRKMASVFFNVSKSEDKDEEPGYCAVSMLLAAEIAFGTFLILMLGAIAHAAVTDFPRFIEVCKGMGTFSAGFAGLVALTGAFIWLGNKYPKTVFLILAVGAIVFVRHAIHQPVVTEFRWGEFASMLVPFLVCIAGVAFIIWMKSKLEKLRFYSNLCPLMEARKD